MEKKIWSGSSSFTSGKTAFGYFDNDPDFIADADKIAKYCAFQLGYPIVDVELQDIHFYQAFENAVLDYSREVNTYKIRDNYINFENTPIPNDPNFSINDVKLTPSIGNIIRLSHVYGTEAGAGGAVTYRKGHVTLKPFQQKYDLKQWALDSGSVAPDDSIEIKRVYFERVPATNRFLDPTFVGSIALSNVFSNYGYGDSYVGLNYLLLPLNYDALRIQAIEFNDEIRRSGYSFELKNNELTIFPIPQAEYPLYFDYILVSERDASYTSTNNNSGSGVVSNISNIPIGTLTYSDINSVGKHWIRQMAHAHSISFLANIRGKFTDIPFANPQDKLAFNVQILTAQADDLKKDLLEQLRATLEATNRKNQLERQRDESATVKEILGNVPLPFYIG